MCRGNTSSYSWATLAYSWCCLRSASSRSAARGHIAFKRILSPVAQPFARAVPNGRVVQPGQQPRRKVVLVLEDHASVGGLIAGLLRQEGYRAVRAWDTAEALRLARGRTPDLVLLDLNLAYPEGLEVLRQVRNHDATRRAPTVLVTGGS